MCVHFKHTTLRPLFRDAADTWKVRRCCLVEVRNALTPLRSAHGASLEAIALVWECKVEVFLRKLPLRS